MIYLSLETKSYLGFGSKYLEILTENQPFKKENISQPILSVYKQTNFFILFGWGSFLLEPLIHKTRMQTLV